MKLFVPFLLILLQNKDIYISFIFNREDLARWGPKESICYFLLIYIWVISSKTLVLLPLQSNIDFIIKVFTLVVVKWYKISYLPNQP